MIERIALDITTELNGANNAPISFRYGSYQSGKECVPYLLHLDHLDLRIF